MGILTRAAREEDADDESDGIEENYMQMFPKIGRDFVHIEDFNNILGQIMSLLDPFGLNPTGIDNSEALARAREYKQFLDQGRLGSDAYKDLIDLEED